MYTRKDAKSLEQLHNNGLTVNDNMDLLRLSLDVTCEKSPLLDSVDIACLSFKKGFIKTCTSLASFNRTYSNKGRCMSGLG